MKLNSFAEKVCGNQSLGINEPIMEKWGQGANLDKISRFPSLPASLGSVPAVAEVGPRSLTFISDRLLRLVPTVSQNN